MTAQKKPAAPKKSNIDALFEQINKLTPEDRAKLAENGITLPVPGDEGNLDRVWGYRCGSCNDIGLEFVGKKFIGPDGQEVDKPDEQFRFADLTWVQPGLPREMWDRESPVCQMCGQPLLKHLGKLRAQMVVQIDVFRESRDKAMEELRRSRKLGPTGQLERNVTLEDGTTIAFTDGEERWSKFGGSKAWQPGDKEFVDDFAHQNNLIGHLADGLKRGR
jgi:hypothetical protein